MSIFDSVSVNGSSLFAMVVVAEDFEELKAEFEQGGCGSGGIEAEGDRDDGGFGDRHPSVFSI